MEKIDLNRGLGWWQYWFSDGRTSVCADQESGGFTHIVYYGALVNTRDIFKGEPIKIIYNSSEARFEKVSIYPFGLKNCWDGSREYSLVVEGDKIIWGFEKEDKKEIKFVIPDRAIVREIRCRSDSLREVIEGVSYDEKTGVVGLSFHDHRILGKRDRSSVSSVFDEEPHTPDLGELELNKDVYVGIASNLPLRYEKKGSEHYLTVEGEKKVFMGFFFANSEEELTNKIKSFRQNPGKSREKQIARYLSRQESLPSLKVEETGGQGRYYHLPRFFRSWPLYMESMKTEEAGAIRANNSYYWVWGWDTTLPCMGLLTAGDYEGVKQAIFFLNRTAREDGGIAHEFTSDFEHYLTYTIGGPHNTSFIELVYRYYASTLDEETVLKVYPQLKKIFSAILALTDDTGMYLTRGMGTDFPEEFGRTAFGYVALEMGWWYNATRYMEKLARIAEDEETAGKSREAGDKVKKNFLPLFYNAELGYLCEAVHPVFEPERWAVDGGKNDTPLITNIGCMLGFYGEDLIFPKIKEITEFSEKHFFTPAGIRYKPAGEKRGFYGWTRIGENWFPCHDIYLARLLRKRGRGELLKRILELYDLNFGWANCAFEGKTFQRPSAVPGVWQAFAGSGWYQSIVQGIVGLEVDLGGLTYIPCDIGISVQLEKFPFRDTHWDIKIEGRGELVREFVVDGKSLPGTLKIPRKFLSPGEHKLEIRRGLFLPHPVLLEATDASVEEVNLKDKKLNVALSGWDYTPIKFFSPVKPLLKFEEKEINFLWDEERKIGKTEINLSGKGELNISI